MTARRTLLFLVAYGTWALSALAGGSRLLAPHDIVSMRGLQCVAISPDGERPTDTDRDDRTGSGQGPESTPGDAGGRRDEFISSEVSDRTARPMRNSKTQS